MTFAWDMTEENWKNYVSDHRSHNLNNLSKNADVYGCCRVGKLKTDFQHTLDPGDWYPYVNLFCLDVDDGYGDVDGRPYALFEHNIEVPIDAKSFDEFKAVFEIRFLAEIMNGFMEAGFSQTESTEAWGY